MWLGIFIADEQAYLAAPAVGSMVRQGRSDRGRHIAVLGHHQMAVGDQQ